MYLFYLYNMILQAITSLCYVEKRDLEENLLSKCENETTNFILGQTVQPEYNVHTEFAGHYSMPPFVLTTVYEDDVHYERMT